MSTYYRRYYSLTGYGPGLTVTNGDPDSIIANHSLNLSGVFNDARQKIDSLVVALKQG